MSKLQGVMLPKVLDKLKKFNHLIGSRTGDLVACSLVPQPLRYRVQNLTYRRYLRFKIYVKVE
jgi:hypothetical protein